MKRDSSEYHAVIRSSLRMGEMVGNATTNWPHEFARVISCALCTADQCSKLLRDDFENIPQPGYIGSGYSSTRLLLVGQNPGVGTVGLAARDRLYTAALREVNRSPSLAAYQSLATVMEEFVPSWPVHGNYFPLTECGLTLRDIAYCNTVRCRTIGNAMPLGRQARNCTESHFRRWVELLKPRAVVFIGKWASDNCRAITEKQGIPSAFMNRQRSLSGIDRTRNRQEVVAMVKAALKLK